MSHETSITSNGHEISHPTEKLSAETLRTMLSSEFHIDGKSPAERVEQLKRLSQEGVAIMLEAINKGVQGSADSLMNHDRAMKVGDAETIAPEYRYDVFSALIDSIKQAPADVNPARVADTLALGIVLLHPFHDGNGRTARIVGLMFRSDFDNPTEFEESYRVVAEPRDEVRKRGGLTIYGYIPYMPEGSDQSNPEHVKRYLESLLHEDTDNMYTCCYGQAPLKEEVS